MAGNRTTGPLAGGLAALLLAATAPPALAGGTERVSVGSAEQQGNGDSRNAAVSARGRYVAFTSLASNFAAGDKRGSSDVFVRDRKAGTTSLVSVSSAGAKGNGLSFHPAMSRGGRYVAFASGATNLVANVTAPNQAYLRDRTGGTTVLVSAGAHGEPADGPSYPEALSADGRYVAFFSFATNLAPGTSGEHSQMYVRDTRTGATTLESVGVGGEPGNGSSVEASLSGDGRWLAFTSDATDLVEGDTNGKLDIFLRDRQSGRTVLVTVGRDGGPSDDHSDVAAVSDDGLHVAFFSGATNLVAGDTNGAYDVFVRDLKAGTTERVSVARDGGQANGRSLYPTISADGRYVEFTSGATNLVAGDTNGVDDVFVRDRVAGATIRASVRTDGRQAQGGGSGDYFNGKAAAISADGSVVAFASRATDLVPGDTNASSDVFVRGLAAGPR